MRRRLSIITRAMDALEFFQGEIDDLLIGIFARSCIDDKQAGVDVGREVRINRVRQSAVLTDLLEEPGAHAPPQDRIECIGCEPKRVFVFQPFRAEADMNLFEVSLPEMRG